MAEFEGAIEIIEEGEEAFEGEIEDIDEEDKEELEREVEEVKTNAKKLSEAAGKFKEYAAKFVKGPAKAFAGFVIKNAAVGVILYGVNVALAKLIKTGGSGQGGGNESNKKKLAKVKAITTLIQTETDMCTNIKEWMEQHQDDTITLDGVEVPLESIFFKYMKPISDHQDDTITSDGVEVPLESIFFKYMKPISDAVDQAYNAAKPLQKKLKEDVYWDIPNAEDIAKLLDASAAFITSFDNLLKFVVENVSKVPVLKSVPIKQADIDDLNSQLDTVKKMPFI